MYSLMLVEDEPIVLEGMLKIIDFEAMGFKVVAACGNGLEALEAYRSYRPDVVVTDICMEIMDGLEFIEEVSKEKNRTKFVIISGHQDFKFFKKALSLKVTDYILKPVTAKEFRELLERIADELSKTEEDGQGSQFQEFMEVEKNMFFNRFMHIKMDETEVRSKMESFGISFEEGFYQVAIFRMKEMATAAELQGIRSADDLLNRMYLDIKAMIGRAEDKFVFLEPQGNVVVIAKEEDSIGLRELFTAITDKARQAYRIEDSGWVEAYIGLEVYSFTELPKSYKSANRLNVCGVLDNGSGVYISEEILFNRASRKLDYTEAMENWVRLIIFGDQESRGMLEHLLTEFQEASYLLTDLRRAAIRMQEYLIKELQYLGKAPEEPILKNIDQLGEKEIKSALRQATISLTDLIGKSSTGKDSYIALKAVAYIENHYNDTNLDLTQVCSDLNVSVSYFSTVFKKYTSMTFVKYLNTYRVEKAKYFLEYTEESITNISEQVGFVDPHYFGIVFKKYSQTSPKKFRMSLR